MRQNITESLIIIACIVGIVVGGLYISAHVECFNFFGLAKGCVAR